MSQWNILCYSLTELHALVRTKSDLMEGEEVNAGEGQVNYQHKSPVLYSEKFRYYFFQALYFEVLKHVNFFEVFSLESFMEAYKNANFPENQRN